MFTVFILMKEIDVNLIMMLGLKSNLSIDDKTLSNLLNNEDSETIGVSVKYPLFLKNNAKGHTNDTYVRFSYDKKHNYAVYYNFRTIDQYSNPLLTNESENFKDWKAAWPNLKQAMFMLRFKAKKLMYKVLLNVFKSFRDENIKWLEEHIAHQRKVFYSVPQPSSVKQKFEGPR